jgi:hypothetical protein
VSARAREARARAAAQVAPHGADLAGDRGLLLAALAGALAWSAQLGSSFPLARPMCELGSHWPLHAISAAMLLLTVVGIAVCWQRLRGERPAVLDEAEAKADVDADPPSRREARRGVAIGGLALNAFFALLIVATDLPGLILERCP